MKLNKIKNIINNSFNILNNQLLILQEMKNINFLHNSKRLKFNKPSEQTYEGYMTCGGACYILHFLLKINNIDTKMIYNSTGYGKYLKDHCILLYNDNIIIDPTYRQFFIPNEININGNDDYHYKLFEYYDYVFIGNYQMFLDMYDSLNKLHNIKYNSKIDNNDYFDFKYWDFKNGIDITNKCDLLEVYNNKKYAISKGKIFIDLHNNLRKINIHF